jgi:predicted RNase H-like HicB family nuclease
LQTPSLSTSQEQGRTLELQRERNEEKIEGGKEEEEEKHQHLPMDSLNLFNIVMVSSRE